MPSPINYTCAADTWVRVALNVTSCRVHALRAGQYLHDYRATGAAAPADTTQGVPFSMLAPVDYTAPATAPIDVYVYSQGQAGLVRSDV